MRASIKVSRGSDLPSAQGPTLQVVIIISERIATIGGIPAMAIPLPRGCRTVRETAGRIAG